METLESGHGAWFVKNISTYIYHKCVKRFFKSAGNIAVEIRSIDFPAWMI